MYWYETSRDWTGTYGGGLDPQRVVAPVKRKKI
jgi:hypothetical protein